MHYRYRPVTNALFVMALGCKQPATSDTGTDSDTGPNLEACAGAPADGRFCFGEASIPKLIDHPRVARGGMIGPGTAESFVILSFDFSSHITSVTAVDGALVFGPTIDLPDSPDGYSHPRIHLANIDGTPLPDVIWTSMTVPPGYLTNANGTFGAFQTIVLPADDIGGGGLLPIDIDGDGQSELLKDSGGSARLLRLIDGTWTAQGPNFEVLFEVPGCHTFWDGLAADFTGDGLDDVAFIGPPEGDEPPACMDPPPNGEIKILVTNPQTNLLEEKPRIVTEHRSESIASGDFDGDGALDLVASGLFAQTIVVMRGLGNGAFGEPQPVGEGIRAIRGDFDGDGQDELAATSSDYNIWFVDSVISQPTWTQAEGLFGLVLAAADLNADGIDDIAAVDINGPVLRIFLSQS